MQIDNRDKAESRPSRQVARQPLMAFAKPTSIATFVRGGVALLTLLFLLVGGWLLSEI